MKLTDEQRRQAEPIIEDLIRYVNNTTHNIPIELYTTMEYRTFIFYLTRFKAAYDRNEFKEK